MNKLSKQLLDIQVSQADLLLLARAIEGHELTVLEQDALMVFGDRCKLYMNTETRTIFDKYEEQS